jgi:hypothetical protein
VGSFDGLIPEPRACRCRHQPQLFYLVTSVAARNERSRARRKACWAASRVRIGTSAPRADYQYLRPTTGGRSGLHASRPRTTAPGEQAVTSGGTAPTSQARIYPPFGADIDCMSIKRLAALIWILCAPRAGTDRRPVVADHAVSGRASRSLRAAAMVRILAA